MAHGIMTLDRMAVGFVELYGKAWHKHPNCLHIDGEVPLETAHEIFDYKVEKVPAVIQGTDVVIPGNNALIRKDNDEITVLYPSVGDRYEVIQNSELLDWLECSLLDPFDISLESIGTLLNGQKAFVNLILNEHTVPGDNSPTVSRLMYSNSFGGDSYQACVHTTRIVCANTLRVATAQGATNATLAKFRHTKNASDKIEQYVVKLADIAGAVREHNYKMDHLASLPMKVNEVEFFLNRLIQLPRNADGSFKEGRKLTRRKNQHDAILKIFEEKDDLQGKIARTRYAMIQAVTDWSDHESSVRNGDDEGGRFWDGIWGVKDKTKQVALETALNLDKLMAKAA